jgi:hypothetical protein
MIGKPSSPVRREAARKRTSPGWYLAARPTHPLGTTGSTESNAATNGARSSSTPSSISPTRSSRSGASSDRHGPPIAGQPAPHDAHDQQINPRDLLAGADNAEDHHDKCERRHDCAKPRAAGAAMERGADHAGQINIKLAITALTTRRPNGRRSGQRGSRALWLEARPETLDPLEERTGGEVVRERLLVLAAGHPDLLAVGSVQPGVVPHHRPGRGCLAPPGRADRRAHLVAHLVSLAGGLAVLARP